MVISELFGDILKYRIDRFFLVYTVLHLNFFTRTTQGSNPGSAHCSPFAPMSFRGRGRGGRGRGRGGGFGYDHPAKHVPHEDFPVSLRSPSARSSRLLVYNSCAASNSFGDSFGWLITAYEQDITLPELCAKPSNEEKALLVSTLKLEEFWRTSCYHLEEDAPKKSIMTELITAYLFVHLTYAGC